MRAVIQRVKHASVSIDGLKKATIGQGILVLLGIEESDSSSDVLWLTSKISHLRIFNDENKLMNLSVLDVDGNVLVVSQFTLFASTKKGNRPSYIRAAKPEFAIPIYEMFLDQMKIDLGKEIFSGIFGGDMKVELINDGPVTIIIDTKNKE